MALRHLSPHTALSRGLTLNTCRARRVLRADRRGSSWPVVVDTEAGRFFTKLRGAARAPKSLVAENIVGAGSASRRPRPII